jgi:Bacterial SH3 domain
VVNVTIGDYLNVRSGAGSTYPVVGRLAAGAGDIFSTGEVKKNGNTKWILISAGSVSGWVNADFVQPVDARGTRPTPKPPAPKPSPISEAADHAKYWEGRGYHFDPNIYSALMMDQEVERIKGSQH